MIRRHLRQCLVVASATVFLVLGLTVAPAAATTPASIDTGYGTAGVTVVPGVFGVTIVDTTGRALVLGPANGTGSGGQITRLKIGGAIDTTFGPAGTVTLPAGTYYTRLALDSSGLIYALGSNFAFGGPSTAFVVTRLLANGNLDTTFGSGGTVVVSEPQGFQPFTADAFTVRNDGEILASLYNVTAKVGYLAAVTPGGKLDTTFGLMATPGFLTLPANEYIFGIAAAPPGTVPVFTADTPPAAVVNVAYSYTFAANGIPAPTFTLASGSLPAGLVLDPSGLLHGTPTTVATSTFTVQAANGNGTPPVTPSISLSVLAPPAFTAQSPPLSAMVGTAYTYTFAASGTPAPTFSVTGGSLPPGLSLNGTSGVLSGTPTTGGLYSFKIKATNSVTSVTTAAFPLNVLAPPVFTADSPPATDNVGIAYSYTFTATGDPTPTFSATPANLPPGLTLNATTGVLSGVPTTAGTFTFTVTAANSVASVPSPSLTITVANKQSAPSFTADTPPTTATVGVPYSYTYAANGNPRPTFSLVGVAPTGLTLSSAGVLSGTPTAARTFAFRVTATNSVEPPADSPVVIITVSAAPSNQSDAVSAQGATTTKPPRTTTTRPPRTTTTRPPRTTTTRPPRTTTTSSSTTTTTLPTGTTTTTSSSTTTTTTTTTTTSTTVPQTTTTTGATTTTTTVVPPPPNPNLAFVALLANNTASPTSYSLERDNSDGTLDSTFGTGGVSAPLAAGLVPLALTEAPDASYYVTGTNGQAVFLAHFLPNGTLDPNFGTAGILAGPTETCTPTGGLIMVSSTGAVYVLAVDTTSSTACTPSPAILLRFVNGALDTTFGAKGEMRIDAVAAMHVSGPNGGGIQPDGQVLVGLNGAAAPASASAAVTRVNTVLTGATVESFTQGVDDDHYGAGTVAPNPSATYLAPVGAAVDATPTTHVFALGGNKHLWEFTQTATGWATPLDITAATASAPAIASPPQVVFDGTHLDVYALGATGDLLEYTDNGTPAGSWTTVDINGAAPSTSPHVTTIDPLVVGGLARVYGLTTAGHLVEIDNDNLGGFAWNFYDLTVDAGGGAAIAGGPSAVLIGTTEHVYTQEASNGDLLEYVADHANGNVWNAYDVTVAAPAAPAIAGNPTAILINGTPHVYAAASAADNGDLIEFVADHLNGSVWNAYDQTTGTGNAPPPVGNLAVVLTSGTPYGLAAPIPEVWEAPTKGDLVALVADHLNMHTWNSYDVTALSGGPQVAGAPTPIVLSNGTVEVFALGVAANGAAGPNVASSAGVGAPSAGPSRFLPTLP